MKRKAKDRGVVTKRRSNSITVVKNKSLKRFIEWLGGVFVLIGIVCCVFLDIHRMPSRSMENTILYSEYILSEGVTYGVRLPFFGIRLPGIREPRQGDVVVFRSTTHSAHDYLKRCIASAGQTVEIRRKAVYVDGHRMADPSLSKYIDPEVLPAEFDTRDNLAPKIVPSNHLFVIGDNRDNSRDSRHWGALPTDRVTGRAVFVFWSRNRAQGDISFSDIGSFLSSVWSLPSFVRWNRLGIILS